MRTLKVQRNVQPTIQAAARSLAGQGLRPPSMAVGCSATPFTTGCALRIISPPAMAIRSRSSVFGISLRACRALPPAVINLPAFVSVPAELIDMHRDASQRRAPKLR
jgi:hypothetical protein